MILRWRLRHGGAYLRAVELTQFVAVVADKTLPTGARRVRHHGDDGDSVRNRAGDEMLDRFRAVGLENDAVHLGGNRHLHHLGKRILLGHRIADPFDHRVGLCALFFRREPNILPEWVGVGFGYHRDMMGIIPRAPGVDMEGTGNQRAIDEHAREGDDGHHDDGEDGQVCLGYVGTFTRRHHALPCFCDWVMLRGCLSCAQVQKNCSINDFVDSKTGMNVDELEVSKIIAQSPREFYKPVILRRS